MTSLLHPRSTNSSSTSNKNNNKPYGQVNVAKGNQRYIGCGECHPPSHWPPLSLPPMETEPSKIRFLRALGPLCHRPASGAGCVVPAGVENPTHNCRAVDQKPLERALHSTPGKLTTWRVSIHPRNKKKTTTRPTSSHVGPRRLLKSLKDVRW